MLECTKEGAMKNLVIVKDIEEMPVDMAIIGVGGCGSNVVEYAAKELPFHKHLIVMNTDKVSQNKLHSSLHKIYLKGQCYEKNSATKLVNQYLEPLNNKLSGVSSVLLITGLGGKTGSFVTPVLMKKLREEGKQVFVIAIEPFTFESGSSEVAKESLRDLQEAETLATCSNDRLERTGFKSQTMEELFSQMNQIVLEAAINLGQGKQIEHSWFSVSTTGHQNKSD